MVPLETKEENVPTPVPVMEAELFVFANEDAVTDELHVKVEAIVVGILVREIVTDVALTFPKDKEEILSTVAVLIPAAAVISSEALSFKQVIPIVLMPRLA